MTYHVPMYERIILVDAFYQQVLANQDEHAFNQLKNEANSNNPWAATRIAQLALEGNFPFTEDSDAYTKGLKWLHTLSNRGVALAKLKLAEAYIKDKKKKSAKKLLAECINSNIPDAAYYMSLLYRDLKPKVSAQYLDLAISWGWNPNNPDAEKNINNSMDLFNERPAQQELSLNDFTDIKMKKRAEKDTKAKKELPFWLTSRIIPEIE